MTVEEFERDCAYCRRPLMLKWKNGPIPSEGVCLVADQVFHERCWDKYRANHNGSGAALGAERQWQAGPGDRSG